MRQMKLALEDAQWQRDRLIKVNAELHEAAEALAAALRFHEERRINPTSRGGPALAKWDALIDGAE